MHVDAHRLSAFVKAIILALVFMQFGVSVYLVASVGAFNQWVRGSFLEAPEARDVVTVALNLLVGAAVLMRTTLLRSQLAPFPHTLPPGSDRYLPLRLAELQSLLQARVTA